MQQIHMVKSSSQGPQPVKSAAVPKLKGNSSHT